MATVRRERDARGDLRRYRRWLRREAGDAIAKAWVAALLEWVDELQHCPERGAPRDDLGRDVRTRVFKRAVTIAYVVHGDLVSILHVFGRGREINAHAFQDIP